MTEDDVEAAGLIDLCDDLQDKAEQVGDVPPSGGGCCLMFAIYAVVVLVFGLARSLA